MTAKMRRRRRHDRRKRILVERREEALFFAHGTFPASAVSRAVCSCGARAFSRGGEDRFHEEFDEQHSYCSEFDYAEAVAS